MFELLFGLACLIIEYFLQQPSVGVFIFYDAPTPPPGLFDDFLAIPTSASTPPTFVTTLPGLAGTLPANATSGARYVLVLCFKRSLIPIYV